MGNSLGDDGKYYGLPLFRSTPEIYYNMKILKKAGISEKQLPKTWDQLTKTLIKIKKSTGKPPFGLAGTWYGWLFEAFVRQNGGALSNENNTQVLFDSPATIGALNYWKKLYNQGLMDRVHDWKATINGFVNFKKYALVYYSSGGMAFVNKRAKFPWMVDLMPKNKMYSTPVGGANVFLSSNMSKEETKAAWKLVKFLHEPSNQATISNQSGYFPVVPEAFDQPLLKKRYNQKQFENARKQLKYAKAKIMTRNYMEIRKILKKAIDETLDKDVPAKTSLKKAQKEAQRWLR